MKPRIATCELLLAALLAVSGCSDDPSHQVEPDASTDSGQPDGGSPTPDSGGDAGDAGAETCDVRLLEPGEEPFDTLAEYCFFGGDPAAHEPQEMVVPYEVVSTLYADESLKMRFLVLPDGEQIGFHETDRWDYPDGTTIIKTFYYHHDATKPEEGRRLLETRLLVKREGEWTPYIYLWDEAQTGAEFFRVGKWVEVDRVDDKGEMVTNRYRVPNTNQCKGCHAQNEEVFPLGPRTRQMNRDYDYGDGPENQLEHFASRSMFDATLPDTSSLPTLTDPAGDGDLEARARSYLDANCGHCHNPAGAGGPSGLNLDWTEDEPAKYGVCKRPVAAGGGSGDLRFDIVPGKPEESIIIFRMDSTDPEFKMPELPTQTVDEFGVELISDWIATMTPPGCPE